MGDISRNIRKIAWRNFKYILGQLKFMIFAYFLYFFRFYQVFFFCLIDIFGSSKILQRLMGEFKKMAPKCEEEVKH